MHTIQDGSLTKKSSTGKLQPYNLDMLTHTNRDFAPRQTSFLLQMNNQAA